MSDDLQKPEEDHLSLREMIDLKISALRSEMRVLFILAVGANQLLAHISVGSTVGYIANVGVLVGAVAAKFFFLGR